LWMGLYYHCFIKCNFIGIWYEMRFANAIASLHALIAVVMASSSELIELTDYSFLGGVLCLNHPPVFWR
jgi:hypothetical protein